MFSEAGINGILCGFSVYSNLGSLAVGIVFVTVEDSLPPEAESRATAGANAGMAGTGAISGTPNGLKDFEKLLPANL